MKLASLALAAVTLLLLSACKSTTQPEQWEYAVVDLGEFVDLDAFHDFYGLLKATQNETTNLQGDELMLAIKEKGDHLTEFYDTFGPEMVRHLNQRGLQGWELVQVNMGERLDIGKVYLKRRL